MAEKTENFQKVQSVGDSWIIAKSKKYTDRIYYFNTETGQAVWNLSEADLIKAKRIDCLAAGKFPEPKDPPSDSREIKNNENYDHFSVRPRVYNKQIINNGYSKPSIFSPFMPLFPPQDIAMPMQYNPNVWALPPQQQFYMAPVPIQQSPFSSPFINPFGNGNPFPNGSTSNNYNIPREQPVFSNGTTSTLPAQDIDVRALHRTPGTTLSDKFKNLNSSRRNETEESNLPRVTIQNGVQDLRQLLIAKRSRNNSVCSGSLEELRYHENKNSYEQEKTPENMENQLELRQILLAKESRKNSDSCSESLDDQTSHGNKNSNEQENTTDDIEDQLEDLHVKSPEQNSIENSFSSLEDDDDKWLSDNMQLRGTKAVIDVDPLKNILGSPEGVWYLILDTTVLLSNLSFINVLINSDEQCRIVIPRGIYEALQVMARGGHKGAMGVRARSACRLVAQLVKTEQAFIDHQENSSSHDVDSFENSCSRLVEMKVPFIALSNDTEKLDKIKEMNPAAFTVEEVKECITLHQLQTDNNISDLPMTITIPNNTSDKSTAAKKEKTKIVYSPMEKSYITSNKTIENDQETRPVLETRHEFVPTISHHKVDSEIQVSLISPKKMVNAEVQTDLYLIENPPDIKSFEKKSPKKTLTTVQSAPTMISSNQKAVSSTNPSNEISKGKKRELKLRRYPVALTNSSNTNTQVSSQFEKKSKWWRRKKVDLTKPAASETRDSIQILEKQSIQTPDTGTDIPDGVGASPKIHIEKTLTPPKILENHIRTRAKSARSQQETTPDTRSNLVKSTETACAKIDTGRPVIAAQKMVPPIQTREKNANLSQETRPESNPIIPKSSSTKPIIAPATLLVSSIQNKQQSVMITQQIVNNDRTDTKFTSIILESPKTAMQTHEIQRITQKPKTSSTQTGTIFSPRRDAYKSPECNTADLQSPKKIKEILPENGMQKMIEESISSSDIVSNTKSSACSEKSIILNLTPSNLRKDSSSNKQMFELTDDVMEETIRNGSEEWNSRFVQIMEEVLTQVLQLDPSSEHEISPPWTFIESTECIKNKFKANIGVRTTATEFLAVAFKEFNNDRGDIRRDLTPSKFLEIFSYAVNFVLTLQEMLPSCEDITIGLESLYQLLNDIKNYNNEQIEFTDNDTFMENYNTTNLDKNNDDKVTNGEKLPETLSTPLRQTDQVDVNQPQVKFIRKFNKSDSFEKLMQKRNHTLTQQPEINYDSESSQSQMNLQDSPNKRLATNGLNESSAKDTFDFETKEKKKVINKTPKNKKGRQKKIHEPQKHQQKIDSPTFTAQSGSEFTKSPVQLSQKLTEPPKSQKDPKSLTPLCPEYEEKLEENALDMDVLDYSENYYNFTEDKLDCVDDNLNFVSTNNDFNDSADFGQYNTNNMDYTANDYDYPVNKYNNKDFHKVNANRNLNNTSKEAIDSNAKAIVNKFLKEMKQTFLHVNSFCEQASKEMRVIIKLTTIRQMELQEQAEEAKCHINNLLNTLNGISNRERNGPESSLQAIFRSCKGIRLTYRDIIEKCSTQARILLDALTSICDMLELALK